jgi:hypothetical protein
MAAPEEFQSLIDSLMKMSATVREADRALESFNDATEEINNLRTSAAELEPEIARLRAEVSSTTDATGALKSETRMLADAKRLEMLEGKKLALSSQALRLASDELRKAKDQEREAANNVARSAANVGREFLKISSAGIDMAKALGTTATQGVQLELDNRKSISSQFGRVEADRMVTMAEQTAAQKALTDSFISTAEGTVLSAEGTNQFLSTLKGGFKSNFELTGASLKALAVTGITTEAQMENFRKSSGRASLSSDQFGRMVNNNSLSFLLYGNSFAKAAANAEKAGIALSSIQGAQESMVSNLDGVVDTVAQLNQLGGNVDFGTLVQKLEMEGPDAVLQYLSSAIPGDLMQSTSFRALVGQLGIPAETLLRQQKVGSASDDIEKQMTKAGKEAGELAKTLTTADMSTRTLMQTFGSITLAGFSAAASLIQLKRAADIAKLAAGQQAATAGGIPGAKPAPPAPTGMAGAAARWTAGGGMTGLLKGAGPLAAIGGVITAGSSIAAGEGVMTGLGKGLATVAGTLIGGAIGTLLPIPGGMLIGSMLGGWAADWLSNKFFKKADDMFSPGYGQRVLMGPEGKFALNNKDSVLAGTNLLGQTGDATTTPTATSPVELMGGMASMLNTSFTRPVTDLVDKLNTLQFSTDAGKQTKIDPESFKPLEAALKSSMPDISQLRPPPSPDTSLAIKEIDITKFAPLATMISSAIPRSIGVDMPAGITIEPKIPPVTIAQETFRPIGDILRTAIPTTTDVIPPPAAPVAGTELAKIDQASLKSLESVFKTSIPTDTFASTLKPVEDAIKAAMATKQEAITFPATTQAVAPPVPPTGDTNEQTRRETLITNRVEPMVTAVMAMLADQKRTPPTPATGVDAKLDRLIAAIEGATTVINIDGSTKTVPRLALVRVQSRNETV